MVEAVAAMPEDHITIIAQSLERALSAERIGEVAKGLADPARVQEVQAEEAAIDEEISAAYEAWEQLTEELAALESG